NLPDCGSLAREANLQTADWLKRIGKLGLVRLDKWRWHDRAGNDHVARAQALAIRRERARHMLHNADHLTDQRLDIILFRCKATAAEDVAHQPIEFRARARGIGWAEDDVAAEDISGERDFDLVRRRVEVGEPDRGTERRASPQ